MRKQKPKNTSEMQNDQNTSSSGTEAVPAVLGKPLRSIGYVSVVFLGVLANLTLMVLCFLIIRPSELDAARTMWFLLAISVFVPVLGTFIYCFAGSLRMPNRIVISPAYVTLFTAVPTLAVGAYVEYSVNHLFSEAYRMSTVFGYLFLAIIAFIIWTCVAASIFQPIIRSLVGAYAVRENIREGTSVYTTTDLEHILEKIEDKKWLSEICSLSVVDRKEEQDQIKLKLGKYATSYYLSIYGKQTSTQCLIGLTPCELLENPAEKIVFVSDDSKKSLSLQTEEIVRALELTPTSTDKPPILYASVNYAMSPARFTGLQTYKNQIIVAVLFSTAAGIAVFARFLGSIDDSQFLGSLAILAALGSTAFVQVSKKT
jgi:hypothetical protein